MILEYKRNESKTVEMIGVVWICYPQRTALTASQICTAEAVEQPSGTSGAQRKPLAWECQSCYMLHYYEDLIRMVFKDQHHLPIVFKFEAVAIGSSWAGTWASASKIWNPIPCAKLGRVSGSSFAWSLGITEYGKGATWHDECICIGHV